jgi:diguanylate cyclase (GGDEF)-like protein
MPNELDLSEVLTEFARTMVTDFPIQGILERLVERIVEIMPITAAGVTLISPGVKPRYIAASNDAALGFEKLQTQLGEGPCVEAYRSGRAVSVPDLQEDGRFPNFALQAVAAGLVAVFTFPLHHGEHQLGALDLYRDKTGTLSAHAMTSAQTLADVAAAYLLNAQARGELQDASERSRQAALHDPLTGLPNRVLLLERLDHALHRSKRSGKPPAMLFADLDRFKAVNDTHGHQVGDKLLVAVAERLTGQLRAGDTLARLSGDEFVILCEDVASPSDTDIIVARVATALSRPFVLSGIEVAVTASIGVARADSPDPDELLHQADLAMYRVKRQRQPSPHILDLRDEHLTDHQAGLGAEIPGLLGRNELHLEYQPIVDTINGQILGVEALLRWAHPIRGLVPPNVLIPLAEQSGLIHQIGQWVLEQAWVDEDRWQTTTDRRAADNLGMSVNVSADQLMSAGFVEHVAALLDSKTTPPELLTLEVTESVFVRDGDRALIVLHDLKDLGVLLALDDFGTGYSSLSYLKQFPVDIVKIDQTFIADLGRDPTSNTIVAAVIQLAHGLGMTATAEGVETAEQRHELRNFGCDSSQGFYFARPMTATALNTLIHDHTNGTPPHLPLSSQGANP